MKKPLLGPIESFSLSPLLSLMPSEGGLEKLQSFTASFFARYERVTAQRQEAADPEIQRRLLLEESMLRQVLDWLAVRPQEGAE